MKDPYFIDYKWINLFGNWNKIETILHPNIVSNTIIITLFSDKHYLSKSPTKSQELKIFSKFSDNNQFNISKKVNQDYSSKFLSKNLYQKSIPRSPFQKNLSKNLVGLYQQFVYPYTWWNQLNIPKITVPALVQTQPLIF